VVVDRLCHPCVTLDAATVKHLINYTLSPAAPGGDLGRVLPIKASCSACSA